MKILIVYAHPEPSSFNFALKERAVQVLTDQKHQVKISDLYSMNFKAIADWNDFTSADTNIPKQYTVKQRDAFLMHELAPDILQEQEKILWSDVVIFQFPLWWFTTPAILTGWFDRVLTAGFAYDKDQFLETGLLKPRKAMLSITTHASASDYQIGGLHGDIETYLRPIYHTLQFAGMIVLESFIAYEITQIEEQARKNYLDVFGDHLVINVRP